MPGYYNPYMSAYPTGYAGFNSYSNPVQVVQPPFMINVDGEVGAKSWQLSVTPQPNMIIPLFDIDGEHVYFRSYDAYGRMNPMRKGRIVFDDDSEIRASVSQAALPDMSSYATKEDLNAILKELQDLKRQNNQNGNNNRGDRR